MRNWVMKGLVGGVMKNTASGIARITLIKDGLLCGDNTRVLVSPMKAV